MSYKRQSWRGFQKERVRCEREPGVVKWAKYVRVRGKKLSWTWERRTGRLRQTFLTLTSMLAIVRDKNRAQRALWRRPVGECLDV